MPDPDDRPLDLQDTAEALGVHYQTAYRWVRSGRLPAVLVDGRYQVTAGDVARVAAARQTPRSPRSPSPKRVEHQAERMLEALLAGDEAAARQIARRLVDEGTSVVALIQTVLTPALRRIGEAWHAGEITVWVEHRATGICERMLGELSPNPRGRRRGTAVVAALTGDRHTLPTTMATMALREANWRVHHLGADIPPEEVLSFCTGGGGGGNNNSNSNSNNNNRDLGPGGRVDVAVLSVTSPEVADLARRTAAVLRAAGVPTVVGGPGRTLDELVGEVAAARSGDGRPG